MSADPKSEWDMRPAAAVFVPALPDASPSIAELAKALAKAQGSMGGALKDSANPFFKSKYADLESVWSACRKALSENGLAVIQTTDYSDGVRIITTLVHSSGQWIRGVLPIMAKDQTPQGVGSAITYARRYSLAAMVGVFQTDDDGEAAHGRATPADPRGEEYKTQDMKKAKEYAGLFLKALEVGIDDRVLELHNELNSDSDFYIAVSTMLSPTQRTQIKDAIRRAKHDSGVRQ